MTASTQHPEYLRQLAWETIYKVPCDALQIYTDGSMGVGTVLGSGIFIKKGNGTRICKRNPDYCSVFRVELLAIEEALKSCFTESWVPSHVNVCENEIADGLTREGSHKNSMHGGCLVFSEIATRAKQDVSSSWKQAPVHEWYAETILVLLCLGQVVGEMKLLLLGFAVDIFELNDMWWKFTLVRIAV
ncbi:UNVERIFIED_CONTAM: hypothetical protein NCL1_23570 [Trichonephila clavipes]